MKNLKIVLLFLAAVFSVNLLFAQSVAPALPIPAKWLTWVSGLLAFYELLVRYVPTVKSYSILTWIIRGLNYLVPDRSADNSKSNHA